MKIVDRKSIYYGLLFLAVLSFVSCQKEIDWGLGNNKPLSNGDLLVKALQITPATNDTNVITFKWDANKRLLEYKSAGKVNGTSTDIVNTINRLADGKIQNIISKSSLTAAFIDSVVYYPTYLSASKLAYVIDSQYTILGTIVDSIAYTYNTAGYVSSKETFTDFFGFLVPSGKEEYTYDGNGNITTSSSFTPNLLGGFDPSGMSTYFYDSYKAAVSLPEESYIIIGASTFSKYNLIKTVTNQVSSGTTYTATMSNQQFNGFNRPTQAFLSVTPKPPGYDMKLIYFYQ